MDESAQYRAFAEAVSGPEMDLARVALTIALPEYPELDVPQHLARVERMAESVSEAAGDAEDPYRRLACVDYVLFKQQGFKGNGDDYYDPENSFLNRVMARKTGIPITLSVLYMEVARRVGLEVRGVGFPGHFLVKTVCDGEEIFVDPFHGGSILSPQDLQGLLDKLYGGRLEVQPEYLLAVSNSQIVQRMLNNIKLIYANRQDPKRCLHRGATGDPEPGRPRAGTGPWLAPATAGGRRGSLTDLERFLELAPDSGSAATVRDQIDRKRALPRAGSPGPWLAPGSNGWSQIGQRVR